MDNQREKFSIGEVYFLLRYEDSEFKYLTIASVIYLGQNLEEDRRIEKSLWFFQDVESYVHDEHVTTSTLKLDKLCSSEEKDTEGIIYVFPEDQLQDVYTLKELISDLSRL